MSAVSRADENGRQTNWDWDGDGRTGVQRQAWAGGCRGSKERRGATERGLWTVDQQRVDDVRGPEDCSWRTVRCSEALEGC